MPWLFILHKLCSPEPLLNLDASEETNTDLEEVNDTNWMTFS